MKGWEYVLQGMKVTKCFFCYSSFKTEEEYLFHLPDCSGEGVK